MKVLLDSCIGSRATTILQEAGHDVAWAGSWERDLGDEEILERAASEGRVLVTLDKDFGELAVARGQLHCGIIRLVGFRASEQGQMATMTLARHGAELSAGAIVTVEPHRVRDRRKLASSP